jgi:hypothetical protein
MSQDNAIKWKSATVQVSSKEKGTGKNTYIIYLRQGSYRYPEKHATVAVPFHQRLESRQGDVIRYANKEFAEADLTLLKDHLEKNDGEVASFVPQNSMVGIIFCFSWNVDIISRSFSTSIIIGSHFGTIIVIFLGSSDFSSCHVFNTSSLLSS